MKLIDVLQVWELEKASRAMSESTGETIAKFSQFAAELQAMVTAHLRGQRLNP